MKRKKVLLTVTGITSDFGETDDAMRLVTMGTLTGENEVNCLLRLIVFNMLFS